MFRMLKNEFRRDAYGLQEFKTSATATPDIGGHIGTAALMITIC